MPKHKRSQSSSSQASEEEPVQFCFTKGFLDAIDKVDEQMKLQAEWKGRDFEKPSIKIHSTTPTNFTSTLLKTVKQPVDLFKLFFNNTIVKDIITQTNLKGSGQAPPSQDSTNIGWNGEEDDGYFVQIDEEEESNQEESEEDQQDEPVDENEESNQEESEEDQQESGEEDDQSIEEESSDVEMANSKDETETEDEDEFGDDEEDNSTSWKPITSQLLFTYIAIWLVMGLAPLPTIKDYWNTFETTDGMLKNDWIASRMGRDEWLRINRHLGYSYENFINNINKYTPLN